MNRRITSRKKRILSLGLVLCMTASVFSSCGNKEEVTFAEYTENLFREEIAANTINLHYTVEDPAAVGIEEYEISLGDFSKEAREESLDYLLETKEELEAYEDADLTLEEQLSYDLLMDYLDTQIEFCEYDLYQEPLSFSGGLQMELPILYAEYEFKNEQDVKDYLELIALSDEYFEQIMDFEREKSEAGMFMSDDLCQKVIDSCEAFLENKEDHYLITTFENRLDKLNLSEKDYENYTKQNKEILEEQLFPAYEDMIADLEELLGTGTNENGICYFDNGEDYYELLVYAETGCEDDVDEIFDRIEEQRMDDLLACSLIYQKNPAIFDECSSLNWEMDNPNEMLLLLQDEILESFPEPPDCTYAINYVDPALEAYLSPAFYIVAPIDNYKENIIYINEGYISSDIYAFTTMAHEGYPGHLYQTAMTYDYDYPNIRSVLNYSGYVEGWATYVEMMSYHYAGLDEDVASFLSNNQSATLSLYASTDIGIHYYGWTADDVYDFWADYGISDEEVIKEITQLILSEPGNYLKYYVGYIEFLELREEMEDKYDSDFSEVEFHRAILDIGPAPFYIIDEYFEDFYSVPQT